MWEIRRTNKLTPVIYITLFIFCSIYVSAAQINYSVTTEFTNTLIPGNNYFGRIVLIKNIVNKTNFNISEINITTVNTSIYNNATNLTTYNLSNVSTLKLLNLSINSTDSICNNYNESLNIIGKALLSINSCYELTTGEYNLQGVNTNVTAKLSVLANVPPRIVFNESGSSFPVVFSKNNFDLNDDSEIKINVTVPDGTLPNDYLIRFLLNSQVFNKTVNINSVKIWNLSVIHGASNYSVGSIFIIKTITINNYGNTPELLNLSDDSNGILSYPRFLMVYPGYPSTFNVDCILNQNHPLKDNNYTLTIKGSKIEAIPINFKTIDTIKPEVVNESIDSRTEVLRPINYSATVKDNTGISQVYLTLGETLYNYSSKEYDKYNFIVTINTTGSKTLILHVIDSSGNEFQKTLTWKIDQLHAFNWNDNVAMKLKKYDLETPTIFLTSDFKTPLTFKLLSFAFTPTEPNTTAVYSIKVLNGENNYLFKGLNDSTTFKNVYGNVTLIIKADMKGDYRGVFELTSINEQYPIGNVSFTGTLLNYSVPDPFCDSSIITGELCCKVFNVDDLETAYTDCTIHKDGLWGKDDVAIPMTIKDRLNFVQLYELQISQLKITKAKLIIGVVIFIILTIFLIVYLLYRIFIRKKMIVVIGSTKEASSNG